MHFHIHKWKVSKPDGIESEPEKENVNVISGNALQSVLKKIWTKRNNSSSTERGLPNQDHSEMIPEPLCKTQRNHIVVSINSCRQVTVCIQVIIIMIRIIIIIITILIIL